MSNLLETVAASSVDEARRLVTGEVNKESPHLTVPFYMPLAQSITLEAALECCRPDIQNAVKAGKARLLAIAKGKIAEEESPLPVQLVLLHGKLDDDDPDLFLVFDCLENEIASAVMMDGDGLRCRGSNRMNREEAVACWMGGFLGWNEKCPGLFRLRYALIDS